MSRGLLLFALKLWISGLFGFLNAPASAQDTAFWRAPPGCLSARQADRALRKLGDGESAFQRGQARVVIDTAPTGELRARIELGSPAAYEKRTLLARDCTALADAALLVIALAAAETEPQEAARVDRHASAERPAQSAAARSTKKLRLGAMSHLDHGSLPHATWGLGVSLGLAWHRTQVNLELSYFGSRVKALPDGEVGGIEVGLMRGALQACYALDAQHVAPQEASPKSLSFAPCLAFEQGVSRGRGLGLADVQQRTGPWSAAVLGLSLALQGFGIVRPVARVDLGARLQSPSFEVQGVGGVFRAGPWFVRGSLGVLVELN